MMIPAHTLLTVFLLAFAGWPAGPVQANGPDAADSAQDNEVTTLRKQLQSDPGNTRLMYQLARQYNFTGQYRQAITLFEKLLKINAENADYLLGIGQSYLWSNRAGDSLAYLEKAVQIAPEYEAVQRALAQAYRATGQVEKADTVYRQALVRFDRPDWATAGLQAGILQGYPEFSLRLSHRMEDLDHSPDNWRETRLGLTAYLDKSRIIGAFAEKGEHFSLDDETYGVFAAFPLSARLRVFTEITLSPTHHFTPKYSLYAQAGHAFDHGWGILAGIRHRDYSGSTNVNIIDATVEKYAGNFRFAYTLFASDSNTAGSAISHRLQTGYYFADKNSVQIAVTSGEEVEKTTSANRIVRTEFTDISLWGEFQLTREFALEYGIGYTDLNLAVQGDSHRKHIHLGIDYRF